MICIGFRLLFLLQYAIIKNESKLDFGEFHSHMALCRKGGFNVLIIRSVKKEEQIQQLAELASQIWNEYFVEVLSKEQITYMVEKFQSVSAITEQIQEGYHYYFIINDMELIGYFGICKQKDGTMFLSKLYLTKEQRGRGYASQAFQFIREKALDQGCSSIWLTVNRHNQQAIAVYEHLGMQRIQEQVIDIGNGFVMDDFIYRFSL